MKTTVNWNEELYDLFCESAMLSSKEREVLRLRIMEYSNTEIEDVLGLSESTIIRTVNKLREKYDILRRKYPDLPPRRLSDKEKWMDEN